jgi:hypothetical protein
MASYTIRINNSSNCREMNAEVFQEILRIQAAFPRVEVERLEVSRAEFDALKPHCAHASCPDLWRLLGVPVILRDELKLSFQDSVFDQQAHG